MATLNAASLTGLLSATVAVADAENLIDAAINRITAHGYQIGNLTGTTPNKTKSVSQAELGWIQAVAVALYPTYQNSGATNESIGVGSISHSSGVSSSMGQNAANNPEQLAEQAAIQLSKCDWSRAII
jgi:hypothetical protein